MKRIEELSEQEILALKEEDIQRMVKFRMAEEGIKLMKRPNEPKLKEMPKPTVHGHKVQGFDYIFQDKAAADRVAVAIQKEKEKMYSHDYLGSNYSMKYLNKLNEHTSVGETTTEMFLEKIVAENYREASQENKRLQEEYNIALREYNNNEEQVDTIREDIYGKVNQIRRKYEYLDELRGHYREYLELAGGDRDIALKFLRKAYSPSLEEIAYAQEETTEDVEK